MSVSNWMSWEGGVDLVAVTDPSYTTPNVIVHVARMVHTPKGSAASGMVLFQPDPTAPPLAFGFVSTDEAVGNYFGSHIFAGTPFETAPTVNATIQITEENDSVSARLVIGDLVIETRLEGLGKVEEIHREPGGFTPFTQSGIEATASSATLTVNGEVIPIYVPEVGITGGPGAVSAPCGFYAR